eukprot:COSAG05_NODE_277_length_12336_cov_419.763668_11_plen_128_part_00
MLNCTPHSDLILLGKVPHSLAVILALAIFFGSIGKPSTQCLTQSLSHNAPGNASGSESQCFTHCTKPLTREMPVAVAGAVATVVASELLELSNDAEFQRKLEELVRHRSSSSSTSSCCCCRLRCSLH